MKGLFLKVVQTYEVGYIDKHSDKVTYQEVNWEEPHEELWFRMQRDMFEVYKNTDNYGITLEDYEHDVPYTGSTSWAGFSYQRNESRESYFSKSKKYVMWYIFIELS